MYHITELDNSENAQIQDEIHTLFRYVYYFVRSTLFLLIKVKRFLFSTYVPLKDPPDPNRHPEPTPVESPEPTPIETPEPTPIIIPEPTPIIHQVYDDYDIDVDA